MSDESQNKYKLSSLNLSKLEEVSGGGAHRNDDGYLIVTAFYSCNSVKRKSKFWLKQCCNCEHYIRNGIELGYCSINRKVHNVINVIEEVHKTENSNNDIEINFH